jgi:hypothetical protein
MMQRWTGKVPGWCDNIWGDWTEGVRASIPCNGGIDRRGRRGGSVRDGGSGGTSHCSGGGRLGREPSHGLQSTWIRFGGKPFPRQS